MGGHVAKTPRTTPEPEKITDHRQQARNRLLEQFRADVDIDIPVIPVDIDYVDGDNMSLVLAMNSDVYTEEIVADSMSLVAAMNSDVVGESIDADSMSIVASMESPVVDEVVPLEFVGLVTMSGVFNTWTTGGVQIPGGWEDGLLLLCIGVWGSPDPASALTFRYGVDDQDDDGDPIGGTLHSEEYLEVSSGEINEDSVVHVRSTTLSKGSNTHFHLTNSYVSGSDPVVAHIAAFRNATINGSAAQTRNDEVGGPNAGWPSVGAGIAAGGSVICLAGILADITGLPESPGVSGDVGTGEILRSAGNVENNLAGYVWEEQYGADQTPTNSGLINLHSLGVETAAHVVCFALNPDDS